MTQEQVEFLASVCEAYDIEHDIRDNYSGRGMYGKTTHAIVVPNTITLLVCAVNHTKTLVSEGKPVPDMEGFSQDNMGRDSIILY